MKAVHPILQRFHEECPELLPAIVGAVKGGYAETLSLLTPDRLRDRFWHEALSQILYPAVQRQVLERVQDLDCKEIEVACMPNSNANRSHTEIIIQWAIITVHALDINASKPRAALYRELLSNGQTTLFELFDNSEQKKPFYLSIVHQHDRRTGELNEIRLISMDTSNGFSVLNEDIQNETMPLELIRKKKVALKEEIILPAEKPRLKKALDVRS